MLSGDRKSFGVAGPIQEGFYLLVWTLAGCGGVSPTEAPPFEPQGLTAASWTFDVFWNAAEVRVSAVPANPALSRGDAGGGLYGLAGLSSTRADLSMLGSEVAEVVFVPGSLEVGPVNAASRRRRVAFQVQLRNRLSGVSLGVSPDFPAPPPGVTAPVLIPFESVATVLKGGVAGGAGSVVVVMPSEGEVTPCDSIWEGPLHNFFNDRSCGPASDDCFLFRTIVEEGTARGTIGPLGRSALVRVGYDLDLTVSQFRARLVLVAGVRGLEE